MSRSIGAVGLLLLVAAAACDAGTPPRAASSPTPAASAAGGSGGVRLTSDACRVLTAADVQSTLGVQVQQLPMSSPPPGGGADPSLVSGCTYTSSGGTVAGASLVLFKDMAIDFFATVPGYTKVPGIGDRTYLLAPRILGQKGHMTFQITLVSEADDPKADDKLKNLARIVASRL
jgi:hypothetical protein